MAQGETRKRVTAKVGRKRYTPRARKCAGCGQPFKPKSKMARTCSNACRQRVFRQHRRKSRRHAPAPVAIELVAKTCICCGGGYFVAFSRAASQKYCSRRCVKRAWKFRRQAAVLALCQRFGISEGIAVEKLDVRGLADITRLLGDAGLHFDPAARSFQIDGIVVLPLLASAQQEVAGWLPQN